MFMTVFKAGFCEDRSQNFEFDPIIFQTVFRIVCEQRETQLTNLYFSHILMTSYTN